MINFLVSVWISVPCNKRLSSLSTSGFLNKLLMSGLEAILLNVLDTTDWETILKGQPEKPNA
jgi:hypothetical protein